MRRLSALLAALVAITSIAPRAPAQSATGLRCVLHADPTTARVDSCTVATPPAPPPPPPAPAPAPPPPPPSPAPTGDTVIASVKVTPNPVTVAAGKTVQLSGGAYNKAGKIVAGAGYWLNGNPGVMSVSSTGLVTGIAGGTANVEFHYGSKVAWSTVTVTCTAPSPTPTPGPSLGLATADSFARSVGVATHFSYFDLVPYQVGANVARTVQQIEALGVAFVRDGIPYNTNASWSNTAYAPLKSLASAGVRVVFVMQPAVQNQWTSTQGVDTALARLGAAAFLAFEGPNEVDNNNAWWGGQSAYGAAVKTFQCAAYAKAHSAGVLVLSPTVTSGTGAGRMQDVTACSDGAAIHPYPGGGLPTASLSNTVGFTGSFAKGKPFWVTETGYHTNVNGTVNHYQPGVSELAASKYVTREFLDYFRAGVLHSSTYEFVDEWNDANNDEANFGLVRNDGTTKPAYVALQRLLGAVRDPGPAFTPATFGYTLSGMTSSTRALALAKRSGAVAFVLWNDVSVYDGTAKRDLTNASVPVTITLARAPQRVTALYIVGASGAPTPVTASMVLQVQVPDAPVVIEVTP